MTALAELRGITKRFEAAGRTDGPEILTGVDLEIASGSSIAIVGPSGSGKSTLLYILGALLEPSAGAVFVDGDDVVKMTADARAELRNRQLGFVFQSHHLLPQLSALENVLVPSLVDDDTARRGEAPTRARALLERVGLGHRLDHRPAQLSGGECQRVAVARALINEPALLLADEPTGSLDAKAAAEIAELLRDLNEDDGVALVTVTHSLELAARMKQTFEIQDGKLVEANARA